MQVVDTQTPDPAPVVGDDGELVIDLRDDAARVGPLLAYGTVQVPRPPGGRLRFLGVVLATAAAAAIVVTSWPESTPTPTPTPARNQTPATTVVEPTAPVETPPAAEVPTLAPPSTAVEPPVPTSAPPVVHVAPAPAPSVVIERSTGTIEVYLDEDPAASSVTMTVGPSEGVDLLRLELLADPPASGDRVPLQVRLTNDDDVAVTFPGPMTVTVIGERDGQRVGEAVLQLPGVSRLEAGSSQLLHGEITLPLGTTTLRAEVPVEAPAD